MIELFHLDEFVDDLTERYSHGMRQRTVFAAALVHEPKLLIADEPTVGLDPKSIRELKTLLRQARRRRHDGVPQHAHAGHRAGTRRPHRHHRPRPAPRLRHDEGPAEAGGERRQPGRAVPEDHGRSDAREPGASRRACQGESWASNFLSSPIRAASSAGCGCTLFRNNAPRGAGTRPHAARHDDRIERVRRRVHLRRRPLSVQSTRGQQHPRSRGRSSRRSST